MKMDMEEDVDDPMEIDDTVPTAQIIERKSDEFANIPQETNKTTQDTASANNVDNIDEPKKNKPDENVDNISQKETTLKSDESSKSKSGVLPSCKSVPNDAVPSPNVKKSDDDVVILDDDDEPMKVNNEKAVNALKATEKATLEQPSQDKAANEDKTAEAPEVQEFIDLVDKPKSNRCLNSNCKGRSDTYFSAPDFCLSYFRVKRSKSFKEEICKDCFDNSVQDYDTLTSELKCGNLIFNVNYPVINETLQIEDSDEEPEEKEEMDYIDDENFDFISKNIDEILHEAFEEFKIENHMNLEVDFLKKEASQEEENLKHLTGVVKEIRQKLDGIQLNLYNQFRPEIREVKGLTVIDDYTQSSGTIIRVEPVPESPRKSTRQHKPVSYVELDDPNNSNSPKVTAPTPDEVVDVPKDLPPVGVITKPPPKPGNLYYIIRENSSGSWIRGRLQGVIPQGQSYKGQICPVTSYKLIELKQQKERLVNGKSIAYMTASSTRLPVGTRVIAVFKELSTAVDAKKPRHDPYYPGIVAEPPFEGNKYRYLIFFDIGYSQYVHYHHVHLVFDASKDVWEDMHVDSRPFIKKYLESQDRPMVKLAKDQIVRTEYNGKWWLCTVTNVDCSLVQVFFDALSRTEWIYRGSTRLSPMFREEQAATNRHIGHRTSRKPGPNESATVVQYTRNNDFQSPQVEPPTTNNVRAVARKSTTKPQGNIPQPNIVPFLPPVNHTPSNATGPTSKIMYFTPRDQVITKRTYRMHQCSSKCKEYLTHNFSKLRGHNPLSKPLLCGWARLTLKSKGKKEIVYKAPCGRMLRNIAEVHYYLQLTQSEMTVDLFDFNHMVRCLAEFSVECAPDPKDLSKGLEQVPIPVINGINNEMLDFCNYSIKRVPMEGVHMNLDPEFLCGCDCEDDCIDKTKCACWKMTLEGARFIGKDVDPNSVGYIYRRLPEQVITGIYECNSRCKCSNTCLNKVVQNPMSLKLQVFKTHNRGWGIRCLNDVPQGSFICIYAGTLHTEQMANEDGMAYGDEYFAELDYIETVEKFKDDYEQDVIEDEEDKEDRSGHHSPEEEEDEEENHQNPFTTTGKKRYSDDNDFVPTHLYYSQPRTTENTEIRTRLRKRNNDDVEPKPSKPENEPPAVKVKQEEGTKIDVKAALENLPGDIDTVTISDDEDEGREVLSFNPKSGSDLDDNKASQYTSVRDLFGEEECVYVMDAKNAGNIGRFLNHSCSPNVFVQNVFVDTQDPRFPWVAFFSSQFIRAGTELTWNYNYDIGSVPGRVLYCHCASLECKGRLL